MDDTTLFIVDIINNVIKNGSKLSKERSTSDLNLNDYGKLEFKKLKLESEDQFDLACLDSELENLNLSDDKPDILSKIIRVLNATRIKNYRLPNFISTSNSSQSSSSSSKSFQLISNGLTSSDSFSDSSISEKDIVASAFEPQTNRNKNYLNSNSQCVSNDWNASKTKSIFESDFPSLNNSKYMFTNTKIDQPKPATQYLDSFPSLVDSKLSHNYLKAIKPDKSTKNSKSLNLNDFLKQKNKDAVYEKFDDTKKINIPDDAEKFVCYYCKLDNPYSTIKCEECGIYFCDFKGNLEYSHIIFHLVSSGHKKLNFKLERAFGEKDKCNLCGNSDIFQLGFVSSNKKRNYLICRVPCKEVIIEYKGLKKEIVSKPIFKDFTTYFEVLNEKFGHVLINGEQKFRGDGLGSHYRLSLRDKRELIDIENWKPFYTSERRLNHILEGLSRKEAKICAKTDKETILKLENDLAELRKKKDNRFDISNEDIIQEPTQTNLVDKPSPVLLCYSNGSEYKETFLKLIKNEKNLECLAKEDCIGSEVMFERTLKALKVFERNKNKLDGRIYHSILGKPAREELLSDIISIEDIKAPNLPNINDSQASAINFALKHPITLIKGPPGTGKTLTSAVLIYNLLKLNPKEKILVSAPSNTACDHLANKIKKTGVKVIRLLSRTKEIDSNYFSPLSISVLIKHPSFDSELSIFKDYLETKNFISKNDNQRLEKLENKYARQLIEEADVICVTCSSSVDSRLNGFKFQTLLVDEACQATEPEILMPLSKGISKLIMIGDPYQLPPVIKSRQCIELGFDSPLFNRLVILGHRCFMLDQQYRMHPFLSFYSREKFYKGMLKDGVTEKERTSKKFKFQLTNKPLIFLNCVDEEQSSLISSTKPSYLNQKEANVIGKIIHKLINDGIKPKEIGVITPYKGQQEYLKMNLKFFCKDIKCFDQIEIASINAYQGNHISREKDFIILSTVRSNKKAHKGAIGFLSDQRRLNVALTRAKYGQIIVGDIKTLINHPTWYELIKFYKDHKLLFSGDLNCLIPLNSKKLKVPNLNDKTNESIFKSSYYIKIKKQKENEDNTDGNDDENQIESKNDFEYMKIDFYI